MREPCHAAPSQRAQGVGEIPPIDDPFDQIAGRLHTERARLATRERSEDDADVANPESEPRASPSQWTDIEIRPRRYL